MQLRIQLGGTPPLAENGKQVHARCPLPSRQTLSGNVLKRVTEKVDQKMKDNIAGKMGMVQCDGWKNVAHDSRW